MARHWRWLVVLLLAAAFAVVPALASWLPTFGSSEAGSGVRGSALALLRRVTASREVPYAGYATSTGSLALPVSGRLDSVSALLGATTRMRVWWRGSGDWRVDTLTTSGEVDRHQTAQGRWTWDYEDNRATLQAASPGPAVRLPEAPDLLPPPLALRLLSGSRPEEVSTLPSRGVAGRAALGLRLRPDDRRSTVGSVDVWADAATAVPLLVEVRGRAGGVRPGAGADAPVVTTRFTDFAPGPPSTGVTAFRPPQEASLRLWGGQGVTGAVDGLGDAPAPPSLAGLPLNSTLVPAPPAEVYGRGVTELVAVPLHPEQGDGLRRQLEQTPGAASRAQGVSVTVGPLGMLVGRDTGADHVWLLAGTVDATTLATAAGELERRQAG